MQKMKKTISAAVMLCVAAAVPAVPAMASGNVEKGKKAFAQCAICHKVDAKGTKGIGPNLFGVFGRTAGAVPGFAYSPALKKTQIKWSAKTMNDYIADPRKYVPGNRMAYAGMKDAATRADVIAYLESISK